jgi:RHS repeat-associated protein
VDATAGGKAFEFDANGNLISDGTRTFEWDARNRLIAVNIGSHRTEMQYNGQQHRVRIIEKENGSTTSDIRSIWCEDRICEERTSDGITVTRRAVSHGEDSDGVNLFYVEDHLGSTVSVSDSVATTLGRYTYDPFGRQTAAPSAQLLVRGFTRHMWLPDAELWVSQYRGYDPAIGRWISQDPTGFYDGPNAYDYVHNRTTILVDPDGQAAVVPIVIVGGALIWTSLCYRKATEQAVREFPGEDKKQHCFAACSFNTCMFRVAPVATMLGQVFHESLSLFKSEPIADTAAAWYGVVGSYTSQSCSTVCKQCPIK